MSRRIVGDAEVHAAPAARVAVMPDAITDTTAWSMTSAAELVSLSRPFCTGSMFRRAIASSVTSVSLPHFATRASPAGPSAMVDRVYSPPGATISGAASAKTPSTSS
jgi:hypothetical protein